MASIIDGIYGIYEEYSDLKEEIFAEEIGNIEGFLDEIADLVSLVDLVLMCIEPDSKEDVSYKTALVIACHGRYSDEAIWNLEISLQTSLELVPHTYSDRLFKLFEDRAKPHGYKPLEPSTVAASMFARSFMIGKGVNRNSPIYSNRAWNRMLSMIEVTYYRAIFPLMLQHISPKGQSTH